MLEVQSEFRVRCPQEWKRNAGHVPAARGQGLAGVCNKPSDDERWYLKEAIEYYTRGMELDYNRYSCSNNVALLLRSVGQMGDWERAVRID